MQEFCDYEKELEQATSQRRAAVELINTINELWYEKSIELVLFRNPLIDKTVSQVLNLMNYSRDFVEKPIDIFGVLQVAKAVQEVRKNPARIDLGKLAYEAELSGVDSELLNHFVHSKVELMSSVQEVNPKDVVLYGFGRIGRLLARELMTKLGSGQQLRLRAVVTRGKIDRDVLEKRASLLMTDSVHGDFNGTIEVDQDRNALLINGTTVFFISANAPEDIDYTEYGIDNALVLDNTGVYRDHEALGRHLKGKGVDRVILTAPGKGVPNIVHGVNHKDYDPEKIDLFSAASCTTNAITPVLKVLQDEFGIKKGHLETIHAYTNDQNLVDNMHSKYRRGRAAGLNMVITETGAGKAVSKALPSLEGKLTSSAIRVPVPNGSLAILNLQLEKTTDKEAVNELMKNAALNGDLVEQIKYEINNELVSTDIIGCSAPSIFDSNATIVDGDTIVIYVWYDNEYGYSHQVMRLAKYVAKVRRHTYY
ncbi:MAG: glyceraldehyde-3-phosphate dehydrogenase [Flavobacteriaceae bacterium]